VQLRVYFVFLKVFLFICNFNFCIVSSVLPAGILYTHVVVSAFIVLRTMESYSAIRGFSALSKKEIEIVFLSYKFLCSRLTAP
jgi:hypothetical protein